MRTFGEVDYGAWVSFGQEKRQGGDHLRPALLLGTTLAEVPKDSAKHSVIR